LLTAVITTKNEAKNVAICLQSLAGVADEIIVIDSFSTDSTKEICESFDVLFLQKVWIGYSATKNMGNALAKHDWILSLDADEELSPKLRESIMAIKKTGTPQNYLYSFNRLTNYCGQWIRHGGWYPDTKVRLFDRRVAKWQGEYVHESLFFPDKVKPIWLEGDCNHYSYHSIDHHIRVVNKYSSLAAEEAMAKGKKFALYKLLFSPGITFIKMYILKAGFLDGTNGFIIAVISGHYRFLKYAKMRKNSVISQQSTVNSNNQ
jgi:glycosyltransferase involved in cell wall biosynthesis